MFEWFRRHKTTPPAIKSPRPAIAAVPPLHQEEAPAEAAQHLGPYDTSRFHWYDHRATAAPSIVHSPPPVDPITTFYAFKTFIKTVNNYNEALKLQRKDK